MECKPKSKGKGPTKTKMLLNKGRRVSSGQSKSYVQRSKQPQKAQYVWVLEGSLVKLALRIGGLVGSNRGSGRTERLMETYV